MGNYGNNISNSGFTNLPAMRYYNLYNETNFLTGIKGDAPRLTEKFYNNYASFIYSNDYSAWFMRGATPSLNTSFSGIFSYNYDAGKGATSISSRFILIVM